MLLDAIFAGRDRVGARGRESADQKMWQDESQLSKTAGVGIAHRWRFLALFQTHAQIASQVVGIDR